MRKIVMIVVLTMGLIGIAEANSYTYSYRAMNGTHYSETSNT